MEEGVVRFECRWQHGGPVSAALCDELDAWRGKLRDGGFIGHDPAADVGYGNLSARDADHQGFIISGTGTGHLSSLGADGWTHVTAWDIDENWVACTGPCPASSETLTHAALYEASDAIVAVAHGHDPALWAELAGHLPTTGKHAGYGTDAMACSVARLAKCERGGTGAVIVMGGHHGGLIAHGASLAAACGALLALRHERG